MHTFSPKPTKPYFNIRSISFPARSHPTALKLEQQLNKLESPDSTSPPSSPSSNSKWLTSLYTLGDMYNCVGDLLALPLTQEALSQQCHQKWVNQTLDGLLTYLEICSNTRDSILSIKQSVRELESCFRRSKCGGETSVEENVTMYMNSRKEMKKEIVKNAASLKEIKPVESPPLDCDQNHHVVMVIRLLNRASLVTNSILHSLLVFLGSHKGTKWSIISKMFHLKHSVLKFDDNEFESVDVAISEVLLMVDGGDEKIEYANVKLEALDSSIGGFEDVLETLFRRLIRARVSLLNIISV